MLHVVRRRAAAAGVLVEEGLGLLQVGRVEVRWAESFAAFDGDLGQVDRGAGDRGVAEAQAASALEAAQVRGAEEVGGGAEGARFIRDPYRERDRGGVPLGRDGIRRAELEVAPRSPPLCGDLRRVNLVRG